MRSGVWYLAALQGFRRLQILARGEHVRLLISDSLPILNLELFALSNLGPAVLDRSLFSRLEDP